MEAGGLRVAMRDCSVLGFQESSGIDEKRPGSVLLLPGQPLLPDGTLETFSFPK